MRRFKHFLSCTGLTLLLTQAAFATDLSGEIVFDKRPPHAGILYVLNGGEPVSTPATVDQKNKAFTERVIPVSKGQSVTFQNTDNVGHNIFALDKKAGTDFDVGLMNPGNTTSVNVTWKENTMVRIGCKIHPRMRAYIANIPSNHYQHFAFREQQPPYTIDIKDLPADSSKVVLMIPGYDTIELDLPDKTSDTAMVKKGKTKGTLKLSVN